MEIKNIGYKLQVLIQQGKEDLAKEIHEKKRQQENIPQIFKKAYQYTIHFFLVVLIFLFGTLMNGFYIKPLSDISKISLNGNIESIVIYLMTILMIAMVVRHRGKTKESVFGQWRWRYIREGIFYALAILSLSTGWNFIQMQYFHITNDSKNQEVLKNMIENIEPQYIWFVLITLIFGPIFEELLYRRLAVGSLNRSKHIIYYRAVLITAIFALVHVWYEISAVFVQPSAENVIQLVVQIVPYIMVAIVFMYHYLKARSLWASIMTHIFNNVIAFVFILI